MKEDRNIYIFTPAGWKHLETSEIAERGGIRLDAADIQALKELYIADENENEDQKESEAHHHDDGDRVTSEEEQC